MGDLEQAGMTIKQSIGPIAIPKGKQRTASGVARLGIHSLLRLYRGTRPISSATGTFGKPPSYPELHLRRRRGGLQMLSAS